MAARALRLHQVLAMRTTVQPTAYARLTQLHQDMKKADLFNGFQKTFQKNDENDIDRAPQHKPILLKADDILEEWQQVATRWFDLAATHEYANCNAKADVIVDGNVILEQVPVTYLLFLDKQLVDLESTLEKAVGQEPGVEWVKDDNANLYRAPKVETVATKKTPRAHVLYEATKEHPAQVKEWQEDVKAGVWTQVDFTSALPGKRKRELLARVRELILAVRAAREEANGIEAPDIKAANKIFGYVFA